VALQGASDGAVRSRPIRRLLIANRGEIAVRIVRACRDLGIEAIVACSEADQDSLAVRLADRAVRIGPPQAAASYLNQGAILAAAAALGADAIHPGYGLLAENASFSAACSAEGITFVGPGPKAIAAMGNKVEARRLAIELGVPVIPGSPEPVEAEAAARIADEVGYPVMLKASAGGGGRGMRLANDEAELKDILGSASAEAKAAFGDGAIYIERFVGRARHVEVQVAFDGHGNGISLGERDCTIQRRYQKLIEEAPSGLPDAAREAMFEAALRLCRHVGYTGVGTVEFLYDQDRGEVYFIEMNTRLQVEHPVTEEVTGLDLVALQLRVAGGEHLGLDQGEVRIRGHAIEFRINAEDPGAGFRPSAGTLAGWSPPAGPGVRVDTHCYPGYRVPPYYDSLLAKVIVWGADRPSALARSRRALAEMEVDGLATTLPFHRWILVHDDFIAGRTSTGWTEQHWPPAGTSSIRPG
jgi:acetyl-CoA carboxylase biotin carboxylase subunit